MIPMRHRTIFKSRWMALVWSAGIIWFAVDVAGGQSGAVADNAADNASGPSDDALNVAVFDDTARLVRQLGGK